MNYNKSRHGESTRTLLKTRALFAKEKITKFTDRLPESLLPKKRIGSEQTLGGVSFVLQDETKVGKLIFLRDINDDILMRETNDALREYDFSKRMGNANIGPKVYTYYAVMFKPNTKYYFHANLLSNHRKLSDSAIYIIMENLEYGASKLQTLEEYIRAGNEYPLQQINLLMARMKKRNVLHGDLHANNILVKTYKSGVKKVYFIDYGKSMTVPQKNNVDLFLRERGYSKHPEAPEYYQNKYNVRGVNQKVLNRNKRNLGARMPTKKKPTTPVGPSPSLKKLFKTPTPKKN